MHSKTTMTMTGAFSVGSAQGLSWQLPLTNSLSLNGYSERVDSFSFKFNHRPDSFRDTKDDLGLAVRVFTWANPPQHQAIRVTETLHLTLGADLSPFPSSASYPLHGLSGEAKHYLKMTPNLRLPSSANGLIKQFKRKGSEQAVVDAVTNWVAAHTRYDRSVINGPYNAAWVFRNHRAACTGYDNLLAGFLRKLGIPSRAEQGWVEPKQVVVPGPNGSKATLTWSVPRTPGELHSWLDVYFPDVGWTPFDPQHEKFFVDTRHIGLITTIDAGEVPLGQWSVDDPGASGATGAPLSNGSTEILPADGLPGGSVVKISTKDSTHFHFRGLKKDIKNTILLSR